LAEEEKQRMLEALKAKEEGQKAAKENQEKMIKKLKKMEDKLLMGTKVMEQAMKQEKEFANVRKELDEKREKERKLAEDLAKKEETNILIEKKFSSQQEEIEDKKKKLQKLYQKYQSSKNELVEQVEEFNRERENYQEQIREISRQIKLKNLILENFVPQDEVLKVQGRATWSDDIDDWILPNLHLAQGAGRIPRPGSSLGLKKPTSEYARLSKGLGDPNPRYRSDNVILLDLDMPERTIEVYDGNVSQKIQNTINTALNEEEDEMGIQHVENQPNVYYMFKEDGVVGTGDAPKERTKKRLQTAVRRPEPQQQVSEKQPNPKDSKKQPEKQPEPPAEDNFPKAKGLIKKGGSRVIQ
jgi:hypothetical protein